jgi:proteic killer suppression protein
MEHRFENEKLERLARDLEFDGGYPREIVRAFRKLVQLIIAANDERDFYGFKGIRFEKMKGVRAGDRSMRLNDQYRLIVRLEEGSSKKIVVISSIEDYHKPK